LKDAFGYDCPKQDLIGRNKFAHRCGLSGLRIEALCGQLRACHQAEEFPLRELLLSLESVGNNKLTHQANIFSRERAADTKGQ
jgi:hypothetical protein